MIKLSEKELVKQVLEYLTLKGHWVWRQNSGSFKTERGGFYHIGQVGCPDIIGVAKDGRFIGIECKVGYNKPSLHQTNFIKQITDRGGIGLVVYSLDEVIRIL